MSVRKIPYSGGSITGSVVLHGGRGSVGYESFLEHDFILVTDFDLDVAQLEGQPVRIIYEATGEARERRRTRRYVPDFLMTYDARTGRAPVLVEIKYGAHLEKKRAELLPKIQAGRRYARAQGWRFRVYTERHIRGPQLANIKFLLPYRRFPRDEARCRRLLDVLARVGRIQADQLLDACLGSSVHQERGGYIACLWWLLSAREIAADLATPLSMSTPLWIEGSALRR